MKLVCTDTKSDYTFTISSSVDKAIHYKILEAKEEDRVSMAFHAIKRRLKDCCPTSLHPVNLELNEGELAYAEAIQEAT